MGRIRVAVDRPNHRWGRGASYPPKGFILTPTLRVIGGSPRPEIRVSKNRKRRGYLLNRLVCEAFYGLPPSPKHHAAHNNGDSSDNRAENLRWATPKENMADKRRHGTHREGESVSFSKLTVRDIGYIRRLRADGWTTLELSEIFRVSGGTISSVLRGKSWASVRAADEHAAKVREKLEKAA